MKKYTQHDFYCICCGRKGLPLQRNQSKQHERFHRKKLYCVYCKQEVNHIECRTYDDVMVFKENFENGVYKDEAEESISWVNKEKEKTKNLIYY